MSAEKISRSQYFPPVPTGPVSGDPVSAGVSGRGAPEIEARVGESETADIDAARAALPAFSDDSSLSLAPSLALPPLASILPTSTAMSALVEGGGIRVSLLPSSVSVLLIAGAEPDEEAAQSAHRVRHLLAQVDQGVTMCSDQHWRGVLEVNASEIVIIDGAQRSKEMRALCREVKNECENLGSVVIVALPTNADDGAESGAERNWDFWESAGADALLEAGSVEQLKSRLQLWTRFARLQREHLMLNDKLSKQVQTDDLTQVLNRRFFFQLAHSEIKRARRYDHKLACLMIDIDHFKLFNKTFGYACGDAILRGVAQTIRAWTRDSDIVARFGAKKFAILLPETPVEGAMQLHEKLQQAIEAQEFLWQNRPLPVSVSIGEAERRNDGDPYYQTPAENESGGDEPYQEPLSIREELAELLQDADAALFVAKKGVRYPNLFPAIDRDQEIIGVLGSQ